MKGLFLTTDLMFSSRVTGAALAAGLALEVCMTPNRLLECCQATDVRLVLVDVTLPQLDLGALIPLVRQRAPHAHLVAFGPHVDADILRQAAAAGCHEVLTRGQFNQTYAALLKTHLTAPK